MLSIDTKLQQRKYQLRKVKVIEVFFVEFKVNFSKFNTQNPMQSLSASAQWNLQKISCLLCISFRPFRISSSRNCCPAFTSKFLYSGRQIVSRHHMSRICFSVRQVFQDILLSEIGTLIRQVVSGHLTSRNWYSGSSSGFRTSYFQKLALRSVLGHLTSKSIITIFTVHH